MTWKGRRRTDPDRPRPLADAVLRLIWEQRCLSRVDIARLVGLSRSTVSEIVNEILPTGLVTETGEGPSRGGRRPIVLAFEDRACVILGVEMGANHVAVALTDLRGRVLAWREQDHPVRTDPEGTRRLIGTLCSDCMAEADARGKPLMGIGVAVPSPIDQADPDRLSPEVMPAWKACLGLNSVARHHGVPMLVDNDANCGALAEYWWSEKGHTDHLAYIKVATGIGSGHVIGGEIYRGATGVAGEIGHLSIDPKGKICLCGLRGCLATLVGGEALVDRAHELLADYPASPLAGREFTLHDIEDAALGGDALALQVVREAAQYLGTAVAGMLNLLNPAAVIFGGELTRLGDLLLEPVRETIRTRTLVGSVAAAEIHVSSLGPRSVAVGAATLILKAALEDSRIFPKIPTARENPDTTPR
ncbi:sugar kinase [bacterium DOLZORAL124_64_63]|nr:MAG: sugar kinase [bacterium DOLZORAL124_64_63]